MRVILSETGKIITGNTPKTSDQINYASNDIPFVKPSDISERDISLIDSTEFWISEYAREKARILPPNSILVTCIGIIGKVAITERECAFNQQINAIIPNDNYLPEYLAYAILAKQSYLQEIANAPVVPIINKSQFGDIEIQDTDLRNQRIVVDKLNAISHIISLSNAQLKKLDELVKSRFVEMFGDFKINTKDWKVEKFSEIAIIDGNMTTDFEKYSDYPHIGIDSIERNTGNLFGYRTVAEDHVVSGKYLFTNKHIIYSKIRPNLNKVALPDFDGVCSADAYPILPIESKCNRVFLAYVLRSEYFLDYILQFCTRTNLPKVNRKEVSGFSTPLPPLELQNKFADFVARVEKQKATVKQSIDKLETLKKSLMQEYFG